MSEDVDDESSEKFESELYFDVTDVEVISKVVSWMQYDADGMNSDSSVVWIGISMAWAWMHDAGDDVLALRSWQMFVLDSYKSDASWWLLFHKVLHD